MSPDNAQFDIFTQAIGPAPAPTPIPRSLLVFAHPDDETVALGARLPNFTRAHIVHVTDGAPRNEQDSRHHGFAKLSDYRNARALELVSVLAAAGLSGATRECLRVPDQEASQHLALLTRTIVRIVRQQQPQVIFTHPYEGGHPDHDSCAFAVHHALRLLPDGIQPLIIEAPFYNSGSEQSQTGTFLPPSQPVRYAEFRLTPEEVRRKRELLNLFASQHETLAGFPLHMERFRTAPEYNFRKPPHAPPVLYDNYPWGTTSAEFVRRACEAESILNQFLPDTCRSAS